MLQNTWNVRPFKFHFAIDSVVIFVEECGEGIDVVCFEDLDIEHPETLGMITFCMVTVKYEGGIQCT